MANHVTTLLLPQDNLILLLPPPIPFFLYLFECSVLLLSIPFFKQVKNNIYRDEVKGAKASGWKKG